MSTLSDGLRQSDRVTFRMPVDASWVSLDGQTLTQTAETILVSRNGGVLRSDFWDIDFPSPHKSEEALARLLMECSFCQRREVVYLNELQLKSFEVRKCVARHCRICDSPSIWIESLSELSNPDGGTGLPAPS